MKTPAVLVAALLAASQLSAQSQPAAVPATPAADTKAPATKPADPKAPAKPVVKKTEPEPVIPGQTIARANGTFLGLQVIDGNFVLSFYDKKKKPMAPDVTRATARWPNLRSATTGPNRAVLNPSGTALVGNRPVVPPLAFVVYFTLLQGEGEDEKVVETYSIQFHG